MLSQTKQQQTFLLNHQENCSILLTKENMLFSEKQQNIMALIKHLCVCVYC